MLKYKFQDLPDILKPFAVHGVQFSDLNRNNQAVGLCPFSNKPDKFFVNLSNGLWDSKTAGMSGNLQNFFYCKHLKNFKLISQERKKQLSLDRGISIETINKFQIGYDGKYFTIPIFDNKVNSLVDLRRYQIGKAITSTSQAQHGIFGLRFLKEHGTIYICEGEWDTMALYECLQNNDLLNVSSVICSSGGAGTFKKNWLSLFQGRDIILLYDNDDPGQKGQRKLFNMLLNIVSGIRVLDWSLYEDKYSDNNKNKSNLETVFIKNTTLPIGFDVRDLYKLYKEKTIFILENLLIDKSDYENNIRLLQNENARAVAQTYYKPIEPLTGEGLSWEEIERRYKKWLILPDTDVLKVIYGCIFANRIPGRDPLWLFIVAPPGGCKSELLMSTSQAPRIHTLTSLTPKTLMSGSQRADGTDPSLIPQLDQKVLLMKDFTTILTMNPSCRDEIFGQLRDAYDCQTDKQFGTGILRSYKSKFGILGGVTGEIDKYQQQFSLLGERFLKFRIRHLGLLEKGSKEIIRSLENIANENTMSDALQEIGNEALNREIIEADIYEIKKHLVEQYAETFMCLSQFISILRASIAKEKYTKEILTLPDSEVGTRLVKQLGKLAIGIALALRENYISEDTLRIIRRVARDTAPDRIELVIRGMYINYISTKKSTSILDIIKTTGLPQATIAGIISDMIMLKLIFKEENKSALPTKLGKSLYRLSPTLIKLIRVSGVYIDLEFWQRKDKSISKSTKKKLPLKRV